MTIILEWEGDQKKNNTKKKPLNMCGPIGDLYGVLRNSHSTVQFVYCDQHNWVGVRDIHVKSSILMDGWVDGL